MADHAACAADRLDETEQGADDLAEGQRDDGQIVALELQGRDADQAADERRHDAAAEQAQQEHRDLRRGATLVPLKTRVVMTALP